MNNPEQKNVVVFSVQQDSSTDAIIDWLDFYGKKTIRIDNEFFLKDAFGFSILQSSNIDENIIKIGGLVINKDSLSGVYFRKGESLYQWKKIAQLSPHEQENIKNETNASISALKNILSESGIKKLGNLSGDVSKAHQLNLAVNVGLNVPNTIITNNKEELLLFARKNEKIIIKAIDYVSPSLKESKLYMYYASILDESSIKQLPETFLPTLCQKYIDKEVEIRSIFIKDTFYSAAIFSQMHAETKVDYRKYSSKRKNRIVPYSLPQEVEKKLARFMNKIGLDTGSIDIIKAKDGEHYFLEVNPSGQFENISQKCNFAVEKAFAQYFSS